METERASPPATVKKRPFFRLSIVLIMMGRCSGPGRGLAAMADGVHGDST
jgi:hypothetical protein